MLAYTGSFIPLFISEKMDSRKCLLKSLPTLLWLMWVIHLCSFLPDNAYWKINCPMSNCSNPVPFSFPSLYAVEVIMDLVFCFKTGIRREWVFSFFRRLYGIVWLNTPRFTMKRKHIVLFTHYFTSHILSLFSLHPYMSLF